MISLPFQPTRHLIPPGLTAFVIYVAACGQAPQSQADLPHRDDVWVDSVVADSDSKLKYVGQTKDYFITTTTAIHDLADRPTIRLGDEIEGVHIGAIKCSFHWRDATYGREQFMWRGRWGCMAGRTRDELTNAIGPDGEKRFDYLHVSPVTLPESVSTR